MDVQALRQRLSGRVLSETDDGWDEARRAWNLAAVQHPRLVSLPETPAEIAEVVRFARDNGLRIAPQGTGHGAGPLGPLDGSVLLSTSRMRRVTIDADRRRARIGAGVKWAEVQAAAAPHGLAGLMGSSPDVGVVGFSLGGGLGWLGRSNGLACNSILAAEVVTADGRILHVDRDNEPDLFWAIRGGGGSFCVVASLEFALYPVRELYAGTLFWPVDRAREILHAWREWTAGLPDTVTSVGRLLNLPPIPEIPEGLRGRSFVLVEAACLTTEPLGIELMRPLRALGPEIDTFAMMSPVGLGALHMDPVEPSPAFVDGMLLADLPPAAVDALVEVAGSGSGSPLLSVELRHLGGALADDSPEHGALASLDAGFAEATVSLTLNPAMAAAVERHADIVRSALEPFGARRNYFNFAERSADVRDLFPPATCERLSAVKAKYDPGDLILSTHPIPRVMAADPVRVAG